MKPILKTIPYMMLLLTASISSNVLYAADTTLTPTKSVIFFLGDGMGPTTVTASRIYAVGENGKLAMDSMKHAARIKTYSEDGQTTDSAPSMGAYMTGQKNKNERFKLFQKVKLIIQTYWMALMSLWEAA